MENVRAIYGEKLTYCTHRDEALDGADALAIMTEWKHFVHPDFDAMRQRMNQPVIFDGRNLYNLSTIARAGFTYYSIGRPVVVQGAGCPAVEGGTGHETLSGVGS